MLKQCKRVNGKVDEVLTTQAVMESLKIDGKNRIV